MKVFISYSARQMDLAMAVADRLSRDQHEVVCRDDLLAEVDIAAEISARLRAADLVCAIVTGSNPNVFYEMGMAAGAGRPLLIAAPADELLPVNLASVPLVRLTGEDVYDAQEIARRAGSIERVSTPEIGKYPTAEATLIAANQNPSILESLAPLEFEGLIRNLFKERGFDVVSDLQPRNCGWDFEVRLPKGGEHLLVEVKKYSSQSRVSVESVRRLVEAVFSRSHPTKGLLVTSSNFTAAAMALSSSGPVALATLSEVLAAQSKDDVVSLLPTVNS